MPAQPSVENSRLRNREINSFFSVKISFGINFVCELQPKIPILFNQPVKGFLTPVFPPIFRTRNENVRFSVFDCTVSTPPKLLIASIKSSFNQFFPTVNSGDVFVKQPSPSR